MNRLINLRLVMLLLLACSLSATAQDARFKFGVGGNYISNNYEEAYLYDYFAKSFNSSYALMQGSRVTVAIEQNITWRERENQQERKTGFIASVPLTFRFQPRNTGFYAGMGPAYLAHKYEAYGIRQKVHGLQAFFVTGVAFRGKGFADVAYPEYHLRAGLHRSLNGSGNMAPMLSFLVQFGFKERWGPRVQ